MPVIGKKAHYHKKKIKNTKSDITKGNTAESPGRDGAQGNGTCHYETVTVHQGLINTLSHGKRQAVCG